VNIPSVASPATTPAVPAAFRNDRREISGSSGHPHGFDDALLVGPWERELTGVTSKVVM
jgi:hypothetical protein